MSSHLARSARGEINQLPCVFAGALREKCAVCSLSVHVHETARDRFLCSQPLARATCAALQGQLNEKARFALGLRGSRPRPAEAVRLQCAGLGALRTVLDGESLAIDVQRLLERLPGRQPAALPWEAILRALAARPAAK